MEIELDGAKTHAFRARTHKVVCEACPVANRTPQKATELIAQGGRECARVSTACWSTLPLYCV